jgi:pSer/pThr/pTyr-binding forkhead associated (FHA) protein
MHRKTEDCVNAGQPALIVTYGNTTRKHRPLDRDVLLIGQNRSCDIGLVSPEVGPIHCVLHRDQGGWLIRDCGSRCGTRVNGKAVHEARLCDGDAVQIGPFSFQAHLPGNAPSGPIPVALATEAVLPRLERSRRKLAKMALRLRHRLQSERRVPRQNNTPPNDALQERQREVATRAARLEQEERAFAATRARHEEEVAAFQKRAAEFKKQLADEEKVLETSGSALALANEMEARRLAEWRQQLEQYADQLEQTRQHLIGEETRLQELKERVAREQRELQERQVAQRQMMGQAETGLREQREALTRMMAELKRLHQEVRARDEATVQLLRQQNEELRTALAQSGAPAPC